MRLRVKLVYNRQRLRDVLWVNVTAVEFVPKTNVQKRQIMIKPYTTIVKHAKIKKRHQTLGGTQTPLTRVKGVVNVGRCLIKIEFSSNFLYAQYSFVICNKVFKL